MCAMSITLPMLLASVQLAGATSAIPASKGMPQGWEQQRIIDAQKTSLTCVCATDRGRDDVVLAGGPEGLILRADPKGWVKGGCGLWGLWGQDPPHDT
jgi:hypothetical protein